MSTQQRIDPAARASLTERPRLLQRLAQARGHRCVILNSPAGSGKTTLMIAWRRELVANGMDVAWLALGPADDEPAHLFDTLQLGLRKVDPALVSEAVVFASRGSDETTIEATVIALIQAIAAHPRELILIFDDAHHLKSPHVVRATQMLLDYSPTNLQCAMATRRSLPLSLGRLRDQQLLTELDMEALRFTLEESTELAGNLLGAITDQAALQLHEQADGWVAGLKLLCMDVRTTRNRIPVRDPQAFTEYFEQEIIRQWSPELATILVHCALPEHFNLELCVLLLNDVLDASVCMDQFAMLEGQGLFLVPAGPRYPDGWWRLHGLLRNVLAARIDALPRDHVRRLHTIAWRFFSEKGLYYDAVHHAQCAGAADAAITLVEDCATELFAQGEIRQLVGLIRLLPADAIHQHPGLHLWSAWAELYEQRLPECARSIAQLEHDLQHAPERERYRLILLRGLHAVQCDDIASAMAVFPQLQTPPADVDPITLVGLRSLLTWLYLYRGEYEKARREQADVTIPMVQGTPIYGTAFGLLAGRCLKGLTHAVEGQVIHAERIYRDVLFEAERRGPDCADAGTLAAALLGEILYELNDAAGALELLESRLEIMERVSIPDTRLRMLLVLGRARRLVNRPLDALDYLEHSRDYAERMKLDRIMSYVLLEMVQFYLKQGESDKAHALFPELEALNRRHAGIEIGTFSEIHVAAERAHIRLLMQSGDLDSALQRLQPLITLCNKRGRVRRIPYLQLQTAAAHRELGQYSQAQQCIREALSWGHRLGLIRTLLDAHEDVPDMIQSFMYESKQDAVLLFYAERLLAAVRAPGTGIPSAASADIPSLDALSPREAEIAELLARNLPNKKIARALDLSLNTVKWHLKNIYSKLGATGRDDVMDRLRR